MERLTGHFELDVRTLDALLGVERCFDMIARDLVLPLSIHVRRTASKTLGLLRRVYGSPGKTGFQPVRGAVHAVNGSDASREALLAFGLVLGLDGA